MKQEMKEWREKEKREVTAGKEEHVVEVESGST